MKTAAQAMNFETTPIKKTSNKKAIMADIDRLGTPTIVWFLVKRHKVGLLTGWAVVMTTLYLFPFVPEMLLSAVK